MRAIERTDVSGKRVLEVGSYDVNGTLRSMIEQFGPAAYTGVDVATGPGVDETCRAEDLLERFGPRSFDVVVSTEMLEHVRDWRAVVSNLKGVLTEGGVLVLTTRSPGFQFHGYPVDFWRFTLDDMSRIFGDMAIEALEPDAPGSPGVFIRARRTAGADAALEGIRLYSIVRRRPALRATWLDQVASVALASVHSAAIRLVPSRARLAVRKRLTG